MMNFLRGQNGSNMRAVLSSLVVCALMWGLSRVQSRGEEAPQPKAWPEQFHSLLFINNSGKLQVTDLWYDWPNGRNMNLIHKQLGRTLYDVEYNNKTSFYFYLDEQNECSARQFEVGILRPNWLNGSNYLGIQTIDGGFTCHVWEKADFIWYYEDVHTHIPVHWRFYTGMSAHVINFEVGRVLEDEKWQAPSYCFQEMEKPLNTIIPSDSLSLIKLNKWSENQNYI